MTVISLTNYSVLGQYSFNGTIQRAAFLPNSTLLLLVADSGVHTLDTSNGSFELLANSNATSSLYDSHTNRLYLCSNNIIQQVALSTPVEPTPTANQTSHNETEEDETEEE